MSSLINAKIERGEEVSRTVLIAAYDMLRVTRRHTGKNGYQEIYDALFRLRSTTITTDIQSGGERETRGFGWIDSFRILTKENRAGNRVMQGLEITLNDWTFRALVKDRRVLAINPAYFDLTGGLERRLYEIAHASTLGDNPSGRSLYFSWRRSAGRCSGICGVSSLT